jgi:hypothetical protein
LLATRGRVTVSIRTGAEPSAATLAAWIAEALS